MNDYCSLYCALYFQLFDRLRKQNPEKLNKLVPICGDITMPELGLNSTDQKILEDNVSIVFHSAATVKFDEALKLSVAMNLLGTKRLVQLCHKMKKLEVIIVISIFKFSVVNKYTFSLMCSCRNPQSSVVFFWILTAFIVASICKKSNI